MAASRGRLRAAPSIATLQALAQDAQRVIDHQVQAMAESDDKAEHLMGLAVAMLAGGLSLATWAAGTARVRLDAPFLSVLGAAAALNLAAMVAFLDSSIGLAGGAGMSVGPAMEWLSAKAADGTWNLASHYASLLGRKGYPAFDQLNVRRMEEASRARRRGLLALALAVLLYTVALAYLLGATM